MTWLQYVQSTQKKKIIFTNVSYFTSSMNVALYHFRCKGRQERILRDLRLQPRGRLELRSSGLLRTKMEHIGGPETSLDP